MPWSIWDVPNVERGDLVAFNSDHEGRTLLVLEARNDSTGGQLFSAMADDGRVWNFLAKHQVRIIQRSNQHTEGR